MVAAEIDLRPFTKIRGVVTGYPQQWVRHGYEYATDGAIVIRIPTGKPNSTSTIGNPPDAKAKFNEWHANQCDKPWEGPFSEKCCECGQKVIAKLIGGRSFGIEYLNLISTLPQPIRWCLCGDEGDPLKVTAGNATVLLMPLCDR